jgi:hypothetical protein
MKKTLSVECDFHVDREARGRNRLREGGPARTAVRPGRVPRVARLMALALHFEGLIRNGAVKDYAEIARLGHVTRARMSQIMGLLNLAPELQEAILFLPPTTCGRDPIQLRHLRPVATALEWTVQRRRWAKLASSRRQ